MTYYVDTANGDNSNDGLTSDTAWLSVAYASARATTDDTVSIVAPATTPARGGVTAGTAGVTFAGPNNGKAYMLGSIDVSHGATIANMIRNGDCEAWTGEQTPWRLTQTAGDKIERSSDSHGGTYSIQATRSAASIWINIYVYLPASTAVDLGYWHKETAGRWKYTVMDPSGNYLQSDGSWAEGFYLIDPNDGNAAWHTYSRTFTTNGAGRYAINLSQQYNGTGWVDDITMGYNGFSAFAWGDVTEHNYKVLNIPISQTPNMLAKCSAANWTSQGVTALGVVPVAADLATCDSTANSWYYDAAADAVYYHPAAGEDVTDLHLELSQPQVNDGGTESTGVIDIANSGVHLQDIDVRCANTYGVLSAGASDATTLTDLNVQYAYSCCYRVAAGSATATDCTGSYTYDEDIFSVDGTESLLTCQGCVAEYAYDDGYQATNGGAIIATRCIARNNGTEGAGDNSGFSAEGAGASITLYNCSAYGNNGYGISHGGTGTGSAVVRNCISYGTVTGADNDVQASMLAGPFTHNHNVFGGHSGAWEVDPTEVEADPLFTSAPSDLTLRLDSPAIDAGAEIAGVTEGYQGAAPDCGYAETTITTSRLTFKAPAREATFRVGG
jgi:hypothetical protein